MRRCRVSRLASAVGVAVGIFASVAACTSGAPAGTSGAGKDAGGSATVAVEPLPSCTIAADPASRPRGKAIAIFHTANVVGEVEPCG